MTVSDMPIIRDRARRCGFDIKTKRRRDGYRVYDPDSLEKVGWLDLRDRSITLPAGEQYDALAGQMEVHGLDVEREGDGEPDESGEWEGVEQLIETHAEGDLSDEQIEPHAYDLNQVVGQYLYATDADERPEGALDLKDRLDAILSEKRREKEERLSHKYNAGPANFGG